MADSFHDLDVAPHPRRRGTNTTILADAAPPQYRVLCPDGAIYEDVDTADAALEAAKYADAMHDNAICDGQHRILLVQTYLEAAR